MNRPQKPRQTVRKARKLRGAMSLPERMLWQHLRGSPQGIRFRKQHAADGFVLDFFCARANLGIEIDGIAHDMGDRPERDMLRDGKLKARRIDVMRIPAKDVLANPVAVAESIVAMAQERLQRFGKAPPTVAGATATSPSQVDGEDRP